MPRAMPCTSISAAGDDLGGAIERQLDSVFRAAMHGPSTVKEAGFARVLTGAPHPLANFAVVSDFDDLEVTRAAIGPLKSCGMPSAVLFPGRGIADHIDDHLRSEGFTCEGEMPAMGVDIGDLPDTALPSGYEFVRVGAGDEGEAWTETLATGYDLPLVAARLFSPGSLGADMASDAPFQFFGVLNDGKTVATSMLYLAGDFAGIYCVATIAEERGKRLGAHLTAEPLRIAGSLGYGVGVLQSSPMGYSVYRRLGFSDFGGVPMYIRMPQE